MIQEVIRRIIEYKILFGLHPIIATDAEIERESGVNRAEIARISREYIEDGRMCHGRTISGKYYGLNHKFNYKTIMKGFQEAIKAHLDKMAAQDEAFAAKYAAKCKAEQDSIGNCCKYITNEVHRKYSTKKDVIMTNAEVFGIAMHYYDENMTPPKAGVNCKVAMSKAELTPEDEEAIRKEARAAAEQKIRDEEAGRIRREQEQAERKRIAAEAAAAKRKEAAEKKKAEEMERKRREWETADLLFNFDEE